MKKYSSTKKITLGSCAFRQPFAESHCKYLHGYLLTAKFWFECEELDENNWVVDFGGLKELKTFLTKTFDHKTIISANDPHKSTFIELDDLGVLDLIVFRRGVGIERFAEYCFKKADEHVKILTKERCWVTKCEIWEHETNSAIYKNETKHK